MVQLEKTRERESKITLLGLAVNEYKKVEIQKVKLNINKLKK